MEPNKKSQSVRTVNLPSFAGWMPDQGREATLHGVNQSPQDYTFPADWKIVDLVAVSLQTAEAALWHRSPTMDD